jgi:hypothetical protein
MRFLPDFREIIVIHRGFLSLMKWMKHSQNKGDGDFAGVTTNQHPGGKCRNT